MQHGIMFMHVGMELHFCFESLMPNGAVPEILKRSQRESCHQPPVTAVIKGSLPEFSTSPSTVFRHYCKQK